MKWLFLVYLLASCYYNLLLSLEQRFHTIFLFLIKKFSSFLIETERGLLHLQHDVLSIPLSFVQIANKIN